MGGASSKQVFKDIVTQLKTVDVDPNDQDFWDDLWKTTLSIEEIFEIISPDDVRTIINDRPGNIKTLFTQAVAQLYQVVETPYPVYFDQALNCMRILSRVLPTMLQVNSKPTKEIFWSKQRIIKHPKSPPMDTTGSASPAQSVEEEYEDTEPMAVILVNAMLHLLFLPDFTIEGE